MKQILNYLLKNIFKIIEYGLGLAFLLTLFLKESKFSILLNFIFIFFLGLFLGAKLIEYKYKRNDFLIDYHNKKQKK